MRGASGAAGGQHRNDLSVNVRKNFPLRIDAEVLDAVRRWADDDLRSLNGHIEYLLREALRRAGRPTRAAEEGDETYCFFGAGTAFLAGAGAPPAFFPVQPVNCSLSQFRTSMNGSLVKELPVHSNSRSEPGFHLAGQSVLELQRDFADIRFLDAQAQVPWAGAQESWKSACP